MKTKIKPQKKGNFRIDKYGNIDFEIGWINLEPKDLDNLKELMEKTKKWTH